MSAPSVLLIIGGSIAAYKSLDLIRRLRERGASVRCVLTQGGAQFITPLSVASLSGEPVYTDLFSLKDESEMGHIRLSREADVIVVAPASADRIASMAQGRADDLAGAILLASDKPVYIAPAMNAQMWAHPATQRNLAQIEADGVRIIPPGEGLLACGETGPGRMADVEAIVAAVLDSGPKPLQGLKALVTSGPTQEPLDPVRYLGNRSSGKQGHAIAQALADAGAVVTLVSGPVSLPDPKGLQVSHVQTAQEMLAACEAALPVDIAVCAAAVADWRAAKSATGKIKKTAGAAPSFELTENPDILAWLSHHAQRPALVIGFAAETGIQAEAAQEKRQRKGCNWLIANDVSGGRIFGEDENEVLFLTQGGSEAWPRMSKQRIAGQLAQRIAHYFGKENA